MPVTLTAASAQRYLSKRYAASDKGALLRLGVTEMKIEDFIDEVERMIAQDKDGFRSRPNEWHSTLASILEQRGKLARNKDKMKKLRLIPLRDGLWVSAPNENSGYEDGVFFPDDSIGFEIPGGLKCSLVADDAAHDWNRRMFLTYLGVKLLDST